MLIETWFITGDGSPVSWATAVVNGLATARIYRLHRVVEDDLADLRYARFLFADKGAAVTSAEVAAAKAGTTPGPVPIEPTPPAGTTGPVSGGTGGLVIGIDTDGVPYFAESGGGVASIAVDTDGVPYYAIV